MVFKLVLVVRTPTAARVRLSLQRALVFEGQAGRCCVWICLVILLKGCMYERKYKLRW